MWPRRQARSDSSTAVHVSTSGARISSAPAAASSASVSVPSAVFASRRNDAKAANTRVKCRHEVKSGEDDAGWLMRALDAKKQHVGSASMKKKRVKRLDHEEAVQKTQHASRNGKKRKALDFAMSVQERQQLWRSGAAKTSHNEGADQSRQQEREQQEVGFDRVFQEVFGGSRNAIETEDKRDFDTSLGSSNKRPTMPSLGPSSVVSEDDEDNELIVERQTKVSGERRGVELEEDEGKETWSFTSGASSALSLDVFDAPSRCSEETAGALAAASKTAEFERWKVDNTRSAVSDNFVRLNMRKRPKGSSGRAKKRPAYLRARSENPLDGTIGDNFHTGMAPLVDAKGSQHSKQEKLLLADDGVDFIGECLEALAKAEEARGVTTEEVGKSTAAEQEKEAWDPPRCHHALLCQSLEVKKKNKNCGRRFFACSLGFDEGRCDFFLWEDDHVPLAMQTLFTASPSTNAGESAANAAPIECVPVDIEAAAEEQREAMLTNLRLVFGHADFRPGQQWAISRVLHQQDTLLVLPTGAGKSLCYQFPALFLPGITLVISPLISLMNDQYESLPAALKARAVCLSGSPGVAAGLSKAKHAAFVRDLFADKLSLIFLSPEKALSAGMQALFAVPRVRARLALVCVDEAHCISEWSHHFRPSYLRLAEVFRHARCVLCVTATASRRVVRDVLLQLRSRRQHQVVTNEDNENESDMVLQMPWHRKNLALEVRSVRSNDERLQHLVHSLPGLSKGTTPASKGSGGGVIVYVHQQRQTEELAALLREQLPPAWRSPGKVLAFHAGMSPEAKEKVRTGFARGRVRVVVATVAFGMGIDKKNVLAVVHFHMPSSVEGYVQQIGRAGRDGKHARALLYLLNEDAVYFRSLLFSTALHREQLRRLLTLVFQDHTTGTTSSKHHVVAVRYCGHRDGGGVTLVSLDRDWLEPYLDLKAATIETFLTLLALESQRGKERDEDGRSGLHVALNPSSMSRCTLQLLDTQVKKLSPCSFAKLIFEAVRRNELPNARVTYHKDGYLSSWAVDFHLHEAAQWYQRRSKAPSTTLASSDTEQDGETVAIALDAATNERRMLQELRAAKQAGQIQHLSHAQPAFQVQLSWRVDLSERTKAEVVDRYTTMLYAKHEYLESRQLSRLAYLYGALHAAALPTPSPIELRRYAGDHNLADREHKARTLEAKFVSYFDDNNERDASGTGEIDENEHLMQTILRPLTPSLIESIERDTISLLQLRVGGGTVVEGSEVEEDKESDGGTRWTSCMVAKVFHGLSTPQLPSRQWRDHICWRRYSDVAFERIVQIAHKVLSENGIKSSSQK